MGLFGQLFKYVVPEIVTGNRSRDLVGRYAVNMGISRALVVTDDGLIEAGWVDQVKSCLIAEGVEVVLFKDLTPNPKDFEVMNGVEVYKESHCNGIISIGGGSSMDCAKGIAIVAANGGHILEYEGIDKIKNPCPPLILIPSTAGTSADVSQFAIVTDSANRNKIAIISKAIVPDLSLVDPEVTTTMSNEITACTGIDALTHALESLASRSASPLTTSHALQAIKLVFEHLPDAYLNGNDIEAREGMMQASLQAGIAFSNASLGAVHAMAHSLGGLCDLPHGKCNAILLPHVMKANAATAGKAYCRALEATGVDISNISPSDACIMMINRVRRLNLEVGITESLTDLGVTEKALAKLAGKASKDACLVTNPRDLNAAEIEEIYKNAF